MSGGPAVPGRSSVLRTLNVLFMVVICAGWGYLFYDWGSGRPPRNSESPDVPESSPLASPQPIPRTTPDGVPVADFEPDALRAWCTAMGLTAPPPLTHLEPAVADTLTEAFAAVTTEPTAEALGRLGIILADLDFHVMAGRCFELAGQADDSDFRWPYYHGWTCQVVGQSPQMVDALERALALNDDYAMTHARLGYEYLTAGRLDEALSAFQRYVALRPNDAVGYVGLARVALRRQEWSPALVHLKKTLPLAGQPEFHPQYYLAQTYTALGQTDLAQQHFDLAGQPPRGDWLSPRDPLLQAILGASGSDIPNLTAEFRRLQGSGNWARLVQLAEKILQYRREDYTMAGNLAFCYVKLERPADAHRILDRALAERPQSAMLHARRAEAYVSERKAQAALAAAEKALSLDPTDDLASTAYQARGQALALMRRYEQAEEALRQAVALKPDDPSPIFFLGRTLHAQGRLDEAAKCYRQVLELRPDNRAAKRQLEAVIRAMK